MNPIEEVKTTYPLAESSEELEPLRKIREHPPAHYTMKIESFSELMIMLREFGVQKYESTNFTVGGREWKLSLNPNREDKKNGKGYVSLYLVLAEESNLSLGAEIKVLFRLFVYNQSQDNYLMIQDPYQKTRRYHAMKREWGFSRLLDLTTFEDEANGYLIDDTCIFGAEVFIMECTGKGESISIVKNPQYNNFTWKLENFSKEEHDIKSNVFSAGGIQWFIHIHPKGDYRAKGKSLSIYLSLADSSKLVSGQKIFVKYELRVMNQLTKTYHCQNTGRARFSFSSDSWGFGNFLPLSDLNDSSKGFILKDNLVVEARILLLSTAKHYF